MFKTMPRQLFGKVQSRLFPAYFQLSAACVLLMIGSAIAMGDQKQMLTMTVALVQIFVNLFLVEPHTTKIMFERYELENEAKAENEERISKLRKQFGAFHGISSLFNLGATVCAFNHAFYLASKLVL